MRNSQHREPFSSFSSKHNITYVNSVSYGRVRRVLGVDCCTQGGILRVRKGSLPAIIFSFTTSGRGAACAMNIPAAKSSARVSIISFTNSINLLRKLAMRLSRVSLNSAICPLLRESMYSTKRRSRSSAVLGGLIGSPLSYVISLLIESESFWRLPQRYESPWEVSFGKASTALRQLKQLKPEFAQ
jgi:hypothetical protein